MGVAFLDADQLRAETFARHVEIHDSLGSTNVRAAELARSPDIELPALVVARHQTAGKGRGQNVWWSADGALTFSLLLDPAAFGIGTADWPQLSLATAVAVCDALSRQLLDSHQRAGASPPPIGHEDVPASSPTTSRVAIKWPNDVLIDGGKICGILIESPGGAAPAKDRLIIGIGINVNNSWSAALHDIGQGVTSLCDVTGTQHDLQSILMQTLQALRERYHQLADGDSRLPDVWQGLCWLTEREVEANSGDRPVSGICKGIDRDGALLIQSGEGIQRIRSGSVRVV